MPAPALYAFRAAGSLQVYFCLDSARKIRVRGETDRVQLGIDAADVHTLDPAHYLLSLPTANP